MSFLQDLYLVTESDDLTKLPDDTISELRKNITDGAKDQDQKWSNALELVHKAYEIAAVQRPNPDMRTAWTQYEENLQYAVEQLSKYRGIDGDWRMSSSVFHEAVESTNTFRITHSDGEKSTVRARDIDDIIDTIDGGNGFDVRKANSMSGEVKLIFSKYGIRKNYSCTVKKL